VLLVIGLSPVAAWAARTVSGTITDAEGNPLLSSSLSVLDEQGAVAASGRTDDAGRFCVESEALAVGRTYRVCVAEQCTVVVASDTDCASALAALGAGVGAAAGAAGAGGAAGGLTTAGLIAIGVGVAGAGAGIGYGVDQAVGAPGEEEPASPAQ
jgi:hypothetical protein